MRMFVSMYGYGCIVHMYLVLLNVSMLGIGLLLIQGESGHNPPCWPSANFTTQVSGFHNLTDFTYYKKNYIVIHCNLIKLNRQANLKMNLILSD